jgi:hypothetical protein
VASCPPEHHTSAVTAWGLCVLQLGMWRATMGWWLGSDREAQDTLWCGETGYMDRGSPTTSSSSSDGMGGALS